MKSFERIVLGELNHQVSSHLDPLQFAYRRGVGVDDALLYMMHSVYSHLDLAGASVRILFFDFSSAFNTLIPHILANKLINLNVNNTTVDWILEYLTSRPQYVRNGKEVSGTILTNIGAPQGTVLSPFLFSLFTSDIRASPESGCHIQKYSDDTALVGYILRDESQAYQRQIDVFVQWCDDSNLILNTGKTKELIIDFRIKKAPVTPILIKGEAIEIVDSYKYLGVYVDRRLDWKANTNAIYKKTQSRLFFLRRLRSFDASKQLLHVFYQSIVASVIFFAVVCWGCCLDSSKIKGGKENSDKINKLIKKAGSVIGMAPDSLETVTRL